MLLRAITSSSNFVQRFGVNLAAAFLLFYETAPTRMYLKSTKPTMVCFSFQKVRSNFLMSTQQDIKPNKY